MKKQRKFIGAIILILMVILAGCKGKEELDLNKDNSIIENNADNTTSIVNDMDLENRISEVAATSRVVSVIDKGYYINYVGEIQLNGEPYYEFTVLNSDEVIGPSIAVHQYSGLLHTIGHDDMLNDINEHPLVVMDSEVTDISGVNEDGKESALTFLSNYSNTDLKLERDLMEYTIIFDENLTIVNSYSCYGIRVYEDMEHMNLVNSYYVSLDGAVAYIFDVEMDDFVLLEME